jgi:hypothetical protein
VNPEVDDVMLYAICFFCSLREGLILSSLTEILMFSLLEL